MNRHQFSNIAQSVSSILEIDSDVAEEYLTEFRRTHGEAALEDIRGYLYHAEEHGLSPELVRKTIAMDIGVRSDPAILPMTYQYSIYV